MKTQLPSKSELQRLSGALFSTGVGLVGRAATTAASALEKGAAVVEKEIKQAGLLKVCKEHDAGSQIATVPTCPRPPLPSNTTRS